MSELASIRETCTPRSDVLAGGLVDKHFAAQLDQVVRRAAGYEAYADAEHFFELTFPTKGLRDLLTGTFARLSGRADVTPSAEHAVYRYETSFGGGKTHGLIALWHLAAGARPANVAEFVDSDLLPPVCGGAAVVGDTLDPVNGLRDTDGVTTWTLWGEIARQLGPAAWELVAASDEARTSCGKQVWLDVFGETPTVIVIDEIAQYLRRLGTSGDEQVRNLAGATIDGLKVLFEAATAAPAARIVFTLATGTTAFGTETADVARTLRDVEAQRLQREAADVMQRPMGAVGRPADDNEIGYILRRRLFSDVDDAAANDAATAYQALYSDLANRGVSVGAATDDPAAFGERIATAYPFHPALIECLDKRIGPLPGFQRARGALKMLAESVAALWATGVDPPILNLGDLPLEDTQVRASVTSSIGREALDGPAVADFAGPSSHAAATDDDRWPRRRMATRSCRTVFLHSVAAEPAPGATEPDIYAGTLRPGEDPELVDEALAATSRVAWHVVSDGARWRLQIAPNANRIIAAEVDNVPNTDVSEELDGHIRRIFPTDGPVEVIHAPSSSVDVADEARLRLAVFSHVDVTTGAAKGPPPPQSWTPSDTPARQSTTGRFATAWSPSWPTPARSNTCARYCASSLRPLASSATPSGWGASIRRSPTLSSGSLIVHDLRPESPSAGPTGTCTGRFATPPTGISDTSSCRPGTKARSRGRRRESWSRRYGPKARSPIRRHRRTASAEPRGSVSPARPQPRM